MESTYLRLSYIETAEFGRQIGAAIETGHIVINGVNCTVVNVSDGALTSVKHALLTRGLVGEDGEELPSDPP